VLSQIVKTEALYVGMKVLRQCRDGEEDMRLVFESGVLSSDLDSTARVMVQDDVRQDAVYGLGRQTADVVFIGLDRWLEGEELITVSQSPLGQDDVLVDWLALWCFLSRHSDVEMRMLVAA